ncbi:MAG TPA: indole-3-glycerol-phosphate synthase [Thermoanaerobaculia bacterium]|nr:indole-3-glycerol-phosphate synthase [Thermoanaerobaculia bacterium]
MSGILGEIAASVRSRLAAGAYRPAEGRGPGPNGSRFAASLREPGTRVIAELKQRSPSAGEICPHLDRKVETLALAYRRGHAAAISVVTEPEFFGGKAEWIARAKRMSGLPVLMKDFVLAEEQLDFAASSGADAVLLIAALLDGPALARLRSAAEARGLAALVEVHDAGEIARAAAAGASIVGVNARDLRSFEVDREGAAELAAAIPAGVLRVAESGIRTREDVERLSAAGFTAFLVGETLLRSEDPEETLRSLRGTA